MYLSAHTDGRCGRNRFRTTTMTHCNRYAFVATLALLMVVPVLPSAGQGYINQAEVETILNRRVDDLSQLPEVHYNYFVLYSSRNNAVLARNTLYNIIGDGDVDRGRERAKLVELLNRRLITTMAVGDTIILPTHYELDFRAYSPFPHFYAGGAEFDKLFIIDKSVQAWGAYEYGNLVRWGIVNTGSEDNRTPNGRFNFNWKTEFRVSSHSPPGEPWEMYWVFNIHLERGIHIHQYEMPTGGPISRGCVRLINDDAIWIYNWATPWTTTNGHDFSSIGARLIRQGTTVLVIGDDPVGYPHPFEYEPLYPRLTQIELPAHPFDVPPGTAQQVRFDRLRTAAR
jgi:hypothetical protein